MSPTLLTPPPATPAATTRLVVLFVDDEQRLLEGIARMLRPLRNEWEVLTANGGDEALAILGQRHVDVLVSDMRMPGMSGADLLDQVTKRHPGTIRMILSGQADRESLLRSIGSTHRYLSKPCDATQIRLAIQQAQDLRHYLVGPGLTDLVARMEDLPSLPEPYLRIQHELQREDPSIERIGDIAAQDMGLVAKLLQLANSGRTARYRAVARPHEAIQLLGIDTVRTLILAQHLLRGADEARVGDLWHHSMACGTAARAIATAEGVDALTADCAFSAGVLHDCGLLLEAVLLPDEQSRIVAAIAKGTDDLAAEQAIIGTTHQELGAYLLGLWGLPDPLVEAVAHHHTPARSTATGFCPLVAVHVAASLPGVTMSGPEHTPMDGPDVAWLGKLGLAARLPHWSEAAAQALAEFAPEGG